MAGMIMHPRDLLDHRCYAWQRPQIGAETMRRRALAQSRVDFLYLRVVETRPAAGPAGTADPAGLIDSPSLVPTAHALTADAQLVRDLGLR